MLAARPVMAATVDLGPKRAWTPHYQPPPEAAMQDLLAPYVVGQQGGGGLAASASAPVLPRIGGAAAAAADDAFDMHLCVKKATAPPEMRAGAFAPRNLMQSRRMVVTRKPVAGADERYAPFN